ncbi:NAD(P)H-hydrate epimerase [Alphaproteobacteria bacterium]|nr:NAD(P)H-hydrate epimerase [Alphaproteobacteria bacterium]
MSIFNHALLNNHQINCVEQDAISKGHSSYDLMEKAGSSVADLVRVNFSNNHTLVLCGPGNNGGDGFVIARYLKLSGWNVKLGCLVDTNNLKTDESKKMANLWGDKVYEINENLFRGVELVIDSMYGTGLKRNLNEPLKKIIQIVNSLNIPKVAVDIPSGINGDNGQIMGAAIKSDICIAFSSKRIGHAIQPGREYCGKVIVTDIGIPKNSFAKVKAKVFENHPNLWINKLKKKNYSDHKYTRGFSIINSGNVTKVGAARLASYAALRIGSGIVGIVSKSENLVAFNSSPASLIKYSVDNLNEYKSLLKDHRHTSYLLGPGNGLNIDTLNFTLETMKKNIPTLIDADAIAIFKNRRKDLFDSIHEKCVLTPHDGEFKNIFPKISGNRLERCERASRECKGVFVLKGNDTVISDSKNFSIVNTCAPINLATAGSGDVLAGIIVGLMSQGIEPFYSASIGTWVHSKAAQKYGNGMIADDIIDLIPEVLNDFHNYKKS